MVTSEPTGITSLSFPQRGGGVTSFQKDLISPDWMSVLQRWFQCHGLEASEVLCQLLPVFWPGWPVTVLPERIRGDPFLSLCCKHGCVPFNHSL